LPRAALANGGDHYPPNGQEEGSTTCLLINQSLFSLSGLWFVDVSQHNGHFGSKPAAAAFSFYIDIGFHFALTQCRHFNETLKNIALVEPPSGDVALCVLGFRPSGTAIIRTPLPR
jgi:hypothetical protein